MLSIGLQTRSQASACVCIRVGALSTFTGASTNASTCCKVQMRTVSVCILGRVHGNVLVRTSPLRCLAACAYNRFLLLSLANGGGGRAAGCHTGAQNVKWANAAVETSTCVHCHRQATAIQRPTNEQVLLADLHVELWSLFVTSGKLAGWSVHVYNTHPDFERGSYGENCAYCNQIFMVSI